MANNYIVYGIMSFAKPRHAEDMTLDLNAIMRNVTPESGRPYFMQCYSSKYHEEAIVVTSTWISEEEALKIFESHVDSALSLGTPPKLSELIRRTPPFISGVLAASLLSCSQFAQYV
jgi:hypothetical protein